MQPQCIYSSPLPLSLALSPPSRAIIPLWQGALRALWAVVTMIRFTDVLVSGKINIRCRVVRAHWIMQQQQKTSYLCEITKLFSQADDLALNLITSPNCDRSVFGYYYSHAKKFAVLALNLRLSLNETIMLAMWADLIPAFLLSTIMYTHR